MQADMANKVRTDMRSLDIALKTSPGSMPEVTADSVIISFYENEIPNFVAPELERLYSSIFSTLLQLSFRDLNSVSTYVASKDNERKTVLLFERKGTVIQILNEGMNVGDEDLATFTQAAFAKYPTSRIIRFHAVDIELSQFFLPFQQHSVLVDIALKLPDSTETYLAGLGKSTRSYLSRYQNKLRREFPSFQHEVLVGAEIEEDLINELIDMHKVRMTSKDKISVIDEKRLRQIYSLSKEFGFAVVMRVEGRICAGTINYRVGGNYYLETVAHDSTFNEYRIGTLCSYLTVCECIARNGKEYHFLWGDYDYKFRLGGTRREMRDIYLYRSRLHMVLSSDFSLGMAIKHRLLQMKKKLQLEASQQDTLRSRIASNVLHVLQKGKRRFMPCE